MTSTAYSLNVTGGRARERGRPTIPDWCGKPARSRFSPGQGSAGRRPRIPLHDTEFTEETSDQERMHLRQSPRCHPHGNPGPSSSCQPGPRPGAPGSPGVDGATREAQIGRQIPEYRLRRGTLRTPVVTYTCGRRAVTVISAFYIGTPGYYAAVRDRAAALGSAGALVLYELIPDAPPGCWAAVTAGAGDSPYRLAAEADAAARYLGLTSRQDSLRCEPAWTAVDAGETLSAGLVPGAGTWPPHQEPAGPLYHRPGTDAAFLSLVIDDEKRARARQGFSAAQARAGERALAALPRDRDAVLVWSSGHLHGLAASLEKAGYRRDGLSWLPAAPLPGLFRSNLSILTKGFRAPPPPSYHRPAPYGPAAQPPRPAANRPPRAPQPGAGQDRTPHRSQAGAPALRRQVVMSEMTAITRAVLAAVVNPHPGGPPSRPAICQQTGLGPATVDYTLDKLLKTGLIRDEQETTPPPGRPPRRYYRPAYHPAWYQASHLLPESPGPGPQPPEPCA